MSEKRALIPHPQTTGTRMYFAKNHNLRFHIPLSSKTKTPWTKRNRSGRFSDLYIFLEVVLPYKICVQIKFLALPYLKLVVFWLCRYFCFNTPHTSVFILWNCVCNWNKNLRDCTIFIPNKIVIFYNIKILIITSNWRYYNSNVE